MNHIAAKVIVAAATLLMGGATEEQVAFAQDGAAGGTVLGMASSSLPASPALYSSLPYDVMKDIRPITIVVRSPNVISVRRSSGFNSLTGIIDAARKAPAG